MGIRVFLAAAATLLLASAAFAQDSESPFINNDIKYKDSGAQHATGRSGNAVVDALALIGKDGTTTLDVGANGTLEKVQLKRANGSTQNFNGLSSNAFSASLNDLARGDAMQIQANVTGVDGARTGVVTINTTVARKPDLTVAAIGAPPHGYAGGPFRVSATIRELNGDSGARANCVLTIDGADADRAENIWVDAGGTISCVFAPSFTSAGDKQLAVRVEATSPGDYDDANNSASGGTTKIYDEAQAFSYWTAYANDRNFTSTYREESPNRSEDTVQQGWSSSTNFNATLIGGGLDFRNIRASISEWTDGRLIREVSNTPFTFHTNWDWDSPPYPCGISYIHPDQFFEMCQRPPEGWFKGSFWIQALRGSGDVTYRSAGWERTYWTFPVGVYTWNRDLRDVWGTQHRLGDNVSWRLTVSDGSKLYEVSGALDLQQQTFEYNRPWSCYTTWQGPSCTESHYRDEGKAGNGWGVIE